MTKRKDKFLTKKVAVLATVLCISGAVEAQNVGINATGAAPDNSAMLDISANDRGVLISRVALTSTTDVATIATPAVSLLVYNTATVADVTPGYYYWNGTAWERLVNSSANSDDWRLQGNAGTNPATNFVGTTDNQDLVFRTNNAENMRIRANGLVGIGNATPSSRLHVVHGTGNYSTLEVEGRGNHSFGKNMVLRTTGVGQDGATLMFRSRDAKNWSIGGEHGGNNGLIISEDGGDAGPYGSGFGTTRMIVEEGGFVGIGTNDPTHQLSVHGEAIEIENDNNDSRMYWHDPGNSDWSAGIDQSNGGAFSINQGNALNSNTLVIEQGGDVGIGTNDPTQTLDINGNTRLRAQIFDETNDSGNVGDVLTATPTGTAWDTPGATGVTGVLNTNTNSVPVLNPVPDYTGAYIDLPPGKWLVSVSMLLVIDGQTDLADDEGYWVRSTFSDTPTWVFGVTPDFTGSFLYSGSLVGPSRFGLIQGSLAIENTTSATKRYYYFVTDIDAYGTNGDTNKTFKNIGCTASFENGISAIKLQ